MNVVIVESPGKAKTINNYLGKDFKVMASVGHVRDLPAKDGSVEPDNDFAMHWDLEGRGAKVMKEIAAAVKGASRLILATDPDREGEAISWHILQVLADKKALKGVAVQRVAFNAITKQAIMEAMKHPREIDDAAGLGLPRPPRARLSRRLQLVAGAVAQVARRPFGRPRAVGCTEAHLRPRGRDRAVQDRGILDHRGDAGDHQGRGVPRPPGLDCRHHAQEARPQERNVGDGDQGRHRGRRLQGRKRRQEAGQAKPLSAVHHLDAADGCLPQARHVGQADDAGGAEALRGCRRRRRERRPHHLHAYRRRADRPRGRLADPRCDLGRVRPQLHAIRPRVEDQGQERPGGARGDPPDRPEAHARQGETLPRPRAGSPLRADLEAHHRQSDGARRDGADHGRDHRPGPRRQAVRRARQRFGHDLRRLPARLPGGPRRAHAPYRQGQGGHGRQR